jgi:hypothetical protein
MANPNDPALDQQKKDLGAQIEQLEQQIADAEQAGQDTTAMHTQLDQLEEQMRTVQGQRKDARDANRAAAKDERDADKAARADDRAADKAARDAAKNERKTYDKA